MYRYCQDNSFFFLYLVSLLVSKGGARKREKWEVWKWIMTSEDREINEELSCSGDKWALGGISKYFVCSEY